MVAALCAAGFATGAGVMMLTAPPVTNWEELENTLQIKPPSPDLTPEQVVALQVASLRAFRTNEAALLQCMALASPANRARTGAPAQFAEMVRGPKYRAFILSEKSLIGSSTVRGRHAMVLVTIIDADRRASVFRFFLSKQQHPRYLDCWMTDSVTPDTGADAPVDPPPGKDVAQRLAPRPAITMDA